MTREQATYRLAIARYGAEAPALLERAEKCPGTWAYTADRHRAVVCHMPAGTWEVVDCAASEDYIASLSRRWRHDTPARPAGETIPWEGGKP